VFQKLKRLCHIPEMERKTAVSLLRYYLVAAVKRARENREFISPRVSFIERLIYIRVK